MFGHSHLVGGHFEGLGGLAAARPAEDRSRSVAVWLLAVAAVVLTMVIVGGATRLTGSGLSITQWKPVSGVLPPLSDKDWSHEFALYRATSQYRELNRGMSLAAFQSIFWWEWAHRLLGRLLGAVFAVPFIVLLLARRLPRRLIGRCAALLALGALQGFVGWWMVKSGLEDRISVAPERLATHLGLALLLFSALIWTGLEAWTGRSEPAGQRRDGWTRVAAVFVVGVYLQCLAGALVAGNKAGLIDNDWPMMGGAVMPTDYWRGSPWATLAHGAAAAQFNHRALAYALVILGLSIAGAAIRSSTTPQGVRRLALSVAALGLLQAMLGIATLISLVALPLALLHQLTACILLASAVCLAWRTRRT